MDAFYASMELLCQPELNRLSPAVDAAGSMRRAAGSCLKCVDLILSQQGLGVRAKALALRVMI
jgi:hypothetical protein